MLRILAVAEIEGITWVNVLSDVYGLENWTRASDRQWLGFSCHLRY
jgi:hypothetical protein